MCSEVDIEMIFVDVSKVVLLTIERASIGYEIRVVFQSGASKDLVVDELEAMKIWKAWHDSRAKPVPNHDHLLPRDLSYPWSDPVFKYRTPDGVREIDLTAVATHEVEYIEENGMKWKHTMTFLGGEEPPLFVILDVDNTGKLSRAWTDELKRRESTDPDFAEVEEEEPDPMFEYTDRDGVMRLVDLQLYDDWSFKPVEPDDPIAWRRIKLYHTEHKLRDYEILIPENRTQALQRQMSALHNWEVNSEERAASSD